MGGLALLKVKIQKPPRGTAPLKAKISTLWNLFLINLSKRLEAKLVG
jgi:hypothetical protein